jgi:hypothetical protein
MRPEHCRLDDRVNCAARVSMGSLFRCAARDRTCCPWHAASSHQSDERNTNVVTTFKDLAGTLLVTLLLPVWMALGLGVLGVIVIRQLYWWARGNTTAVSRPAPARSVAALPVEVVS